MFTIANKSVLALAVAATVIVPLQSANAGDWNRRHRNEAAALGVIGLAAGLAVGSALTRPSEPDGPVYIDPPRRGPVSAEPEYVYEDPYANDGYYPEPPRTVYQRPRPVYQAQPVYEIRPAYQPRTVYRTIEPWSQSWYDYCSQRYRSFNARTGTYTDYSGQRHFCTAG